jgi:hypothetical protein
VNGERSSKWGVATGLGGLLLALCCVAGPVIFGVAIGATLGGALDVVAATLIALAIAVVLLGRRRARGRSC